MIVILAGGAVVLPPLDSPQPAPAAPVDPPAMAVCAIEEGSGRVTTVDVASAVDGSGTLTAFAAGSTVGAVDFETDTSNVSAIPMAEVAAVGIGGALLELPDLASAATTVVTGANSLAIDSCPVAAGGDLILGGGSTLSDQRFAVQLMNPYAGEAIVNFFVLSDAGLESSDALDSVIVPARSTILVDLAEILPGREWMTVAIEVDTGGVLAVGRLGIGSDNAIWSAVAPAQDWFVPVPHGLESRQVVIAAWDSDVEYQIDLYGPDGLVEAFESGQIPARGQAVFDVGAVSAVASAVRVVTTGPVGAFVRITSDTGVTMTSGSPTPASALLLPGAGSIAGGSGWLVVLNPGLEDVSAEVTTLGPAPERLSLAIPAGEVSETALSSGGALGYAISGDGPLVATWSTTTSSAIGLGTAVPISDG
jgi:hypothetical protein